MYFLSTNFLGYGLDYHPLKMADGYLPSGDKKRKAQVCLNGVEIMRKYDPDRPYFFQAGGNFGEVITSNAYFCWWPQTEKNAWPQEWSKIGKKPLHIIETSFPYVNSYFGMDRFGGNRPLFVYENAARYFGSDAYKSPDPDLLEQTAISSKGGDARTAAHDIMRICEHYPAPALHVLMNFMSTHDTVRAITAIAGESCEGRDRYWQSARRLTPEQYENGRRLMTLAYAMIFTLPGIPSIYYGDEIGMQGYKDPFNRAFFDWESRETRIRPVLQNLAALRKSCPAFADGTLAVIQAQGGVLCYERRAEAAVAAVCINRTEQQVRTVLLGRTVEVQPCSFAVVTDPE